MTISKLIYIMLTALLLNDYNCQAAEVPIEPMGCSGAPLGAVWVENLDQKIKEYHLLMQNSELEMDRNSQIGINTNIALFGLSVLRTDGTFVSLLDRMSKIFLSGGRMLTNPHKEELKEIGVAKEVLKQKITTKETQIVNKISDIALLAQKHKAQVKDCLVSFDESYSQVQKLRDELDQHKKSLAELQENEKRYSPEIFAENARYKDHTNAIYDPEQTITRIVDYHIDKAISNEENITINDSTFKKSEIDIFVLNIHSRTDMCPFCCMFLAYNLKKWREKLPIVVIVSSRQEYRCGFSFITQQPYYRGYSMRSFAWRKQDTGSLEGIKEIAKDGLVVQYHFLPLEGYNAADSFANSLEKAA